MSATHDKTQKIVFSYTNLYHVFKGKAPYPAQETVAVVKRDTAPVRGLKDSLKALNELHARLRVMLVELEDLTRKR